MTTNIRPGDAIRALRVLAGALAARTGPRRRGRWLLPLAFVGVAGAGVAAGGALASDPPVPPAERTRIEAVIRDYILTHPEIIPEAIQALRDKEGRKAVADNRSALETPYAGAWEGAADGDVVLVEFFDYACGYCRASVPEVARLLAEDKRLKLVYRELPILGEPSVAAARVGLLAARIGRYPAFHRAMYGRDRVDRATTLAAAAVAGLDRAQSQAALAATGPVDEFTHNVALAEALGARGTPLFVVGDQVLNGAVGYDALKAAVAKARERTAGPPQ